MDNAAMESEPPKTDPPKRNRRWFQFSLRTLLIGVALLAMPCAYVGWQGRDVRERKEAMKKFVHAYAIYGMPISRNPASQLRRWLGDTRIESFYFDKEASDDEIQTARREFPEAAIHRDKPALTAEQSLSRDTWLAPAVGDWR
jgi:hypothetical protein